MNIKPILFSTPMVQEILEGRKTQTRRIAAEKLYLDKEWGLDREPYFKNGKWYYDKQIAVDDSRTYELKPKYQVGDILWVQETWKVIRLLENMQMQFEYRADGVISKTIDFLLDRFTKFKKFADKNGWQSPYFMPREAARIFLRVTNVRVERLQEITEYDALKEGCMPTILDDAIFFSAKGKFHALWDSLNAKRGYGWDTNPYVWVYELERVEGIKC